MVQGLNANNYGSISKIGRTDNGRVIYQVSDPEGNVAGKISVSEQSCDVFEKSYNDMMDAAPKMQKYAEEYSDPRKQEKMKNINKWSKIIGASVGLVGASILTRKMSKFVWKSLICIPSAVAGFVLGALAGAKITTPKEAVKFSNAMQAISKLDVKPYEEG